LQLFRSLAPGVVIFVQLHNSGCLFLEPSSWTGWVESLSQW
jgi:hypothetical protein